MIPGTLSDLLRASGFIVDEDARAPAGANLSRPPAESGQARDAGARAIACVPSVPAVPTPNDRKRGASEAEGIETAPGLAGGQGDASARTAGRERLLALAAQHGLAVGRVAALDDADPLELAALPDEVLVAYARALLCTGERRAGRVPEGWSVASECEGCGPVWLWPGAGRVRACPWCWERVAGREVPRPSGSFRDVDAEGNSDPAGGVGSEPGTALTARATG